MTRAALSLLVILRLGNFSQKGFRLKKYRSRSGLKLFGITSDLIYVTGITDPKIGSVLAFNNTLL